LALGFVDKSLKQSKTLKLLYTCLKRIGINFHRLYEFIALNPSMLFALIPSFPRESAVKRRAIPRKIQLKKITYIALSRLQDLMLYFALH
jgi:hypothetical protein